MAADHNIGWEAEINATGVSRGLAARLKLPAHPIADIDGEVAPVLICVKAKGHQSPSDLQQEIDEIWKVSGGRDSMKFLHCQSVFF